MEFWNEPCSLRPQDGFPAEGETPFEAWLRSLTRAFDRLASEFTQVQVIGHSFGALGAVFLALRRPEKVGQLTLLAPALDLLSTQKNILKLAIQDFEESGENSKANQLRELLIQSVRAMDAPMEKAAQIALTDPRLMTHYFVSPAKLGEWASYLGAPEAQMDVAAYFGVSKSLPSFEELCQSARAQPLEAPRPGASSLASAALELSIDVRALFGANDPVVSGGFASSEVQIETLRRVFPQAKIEVIESAGHFVHLEAPRALFG